MFNTNARAVFATAPSPHHTKIHENILGTGETAFKKLYRMGHVLCFSHYKQYWHCFPTPSAVAWKCSAGIFDWFFYP